MNNKLRPLYLGLFPLIVLIPPILERIGVLHSPRITAGALLATVALSLIIGIVLIILDANRSRDSFFLHALQTALIATVVFMYLDIAFGGIELVRSIVPSGIEESKLYLLIFHWLAFLFVTSSIGFVIWMLGSAAINILVFSFGIAAVVGVLLPTKAPFENWDSRRPSVSYENEASAAPEVYILFDGMVGPEGIDQSIPGGREFYAAVRQFHERHGFRLYGRAFSRHFKTAFSVPNMLNYRYVGEGNTDSLLSYDDTSRRAVMHTNQFFDEIQARNEEILVYQTPFISYCEHLAVATCKTISLYDPLDGNLPGDLATWRPGDLALGDFVLFYKQSRDILVQYSVVLKYVFAVTNRVISVYVSEEEREFLNYPRLKRFSALNFPRLWDDFQSRLLREDSGGVFFAHFLVPHTPDDLGGNCRPSGEMWTHRGNEYGLAITEDMGLTGTAFESAREKSMMTYFKQAGCVYKKLDALLSAMGVNPVLRNATVVLMGDHGSRKSAGPSFESLDKQDYIDNHSTLFSIKAPGVSPGYDGRKISVQQLFAAFLAESMEVDLTEAEQTVAVPSLKSGEMRVVPMPNF